MIRTCTEVDVPAIDTIINEAATAYRGHVPDDCLHDPYMSRDELLHEMNSGVGFSGWEENGELLGVMGIQDVKDVSLIRHAYVRSTAQGKGVGSALLTHLTSRTARPLLVGTWAAAQWAVRLYERHGFRLVNDEEKDRLLATYWNITDRQRETSVVLVHRSSGERLA
ncbi:MAG: GNAT family N-acetyltransferase [Acidobacteriota bacterium]